MGGTLRGAGRIVCSACTGRRPTRTRRPCRTYPHREGRTPYTPCPATGRKRLLCSTRRRPPHTQRNRFAPGPMHSERRVADQLIVHVADGARRRGRGGIHAYIAAAAQAGLRYLVPELHAVLALGPIPRAAHRLVAHVPLREEAALLADVAVRVGPVQAAGAVAAGVRTRRAARDAAALRRVIRAA